MTTSSTTNRSILMMLCSVLLFSTNVLLVHWLSVQFSQVDGWMTTLFRGVVGMAVTITVFGFGRGLSLKSLLVKRLVLLRGIAGAIGILLLYITLDHMNAGRAVVLNLTYPLFGMIIAAVWLKERPSWKAVTWTVVAFGGLLVFLGPEVFQNGVSRYDLLALTGAVTAGFVIVMIRLLHRTESTSTIYASQCLWSALISMPVSGTVALKLPGSLWIWLSVAACTVAVAQLMMTRAFKDLSIARGSAIQMTLPVVTAVGGYVFFKETLSPLEITGATITLFATWRVVVSK